MKQPSSFRLWATCLGLASVCFPGFSQANPSEARRHLERGDYSEARDRYESLADGANSSSRRAALRLGQGLAAYRGGDFRGARAGYSEALLGPDPRVRRKAHIGLGNSLFQLGWIGLADRAYPADPEMVPDLDAFDAIVRERIGSMLDGPEPDVGETDGFARIRDTILNWNDAARHYQSALDLDSRDSTALANRRTTLVFLERLRDLLEEEREETEQSIPEPSPGEGGNEGDPEPGEGDPGEGDPGEGDPGEGDPGEGDPGEDTGENDQSGENQDKDQEGGDQPDESDPSGNDGESEDDPRGDESEGPPQESKADSGEDEMESGDPNESPEDRARRILNENADVETGPLNPGRRDFSQPEKDW